MDGDVDQMPMPPEHTTLRAARQESRDSSAVLLLGETIKELRIEQRAAVEWLARLQSKGLAAEEKLAEIFVGSRCLSS